MAPLMDQGQNTNLETESNHCYIMLYSSRLHAEEQDWLLLWRLATPSCGGDVSVIQQDINIHI